MPELSTGLVIAGAYADKLRRTLFAQLRDQMKQGIVSGQDIARAAAEINRLLYEILVDDLRIDKGDVVRIRISYDLVDGEIKWHLDTLRIEAFRRIPDEEVMNRVRARIKEIGRTEEKKAGRGPEARREEETVERGENVSSASFLGETIDGAQLFLLKNREGENVGLAMIEGRAGIMVLDAVVVPGKGKKPYRIYMKLGEEAEKLRGNPERLVDILSRATPTYIGDEEAKQLIEERMKKLV